MPGPIGRRATVLAALLATFALGRADVATNTLALTERGGVVGGSAGTIVPLTDTSFLVAVQGPDETAPSADDQLLLVTGPDGDRTITPITVPMGSSWSGRTTRLSATRAARPGAGPDGTWGTADDVVNLVDAIGTTNTVTPITVGYLGEQDRHAVVRLAPDTVLVNTGGPDGSLRSADDRIALIEDLGGANTVTFLAAPYLRNDGGGIPVALSRTTAVVTALGPGEMFPSATDRVFVFTDLGGSNARMEIATPFLSRRRAGRPERLDAGTAIVGFYDDDGSDGYEQGVYLLSDLTGTPTATVVPTERLYEFGASAPVRLSATSALVVTRGADRTDKTADDEVVLLSDLGGANLVTPIVIGGLDEDGQVRPVPLSPTSCVVLSGGADFRSENGDLSNDELVFISDLGGANTIQRIVLGGIGWGSAGRPLALSETAVVLMTTGPDLSWGGDGPDAVTFVEGLGGTPRITPFATTGHVANFTFSFPNAPQSLGAGGIALVDSGPDHDLYGDDDLLRFFTGLPEGGARLEVVRAKIRFDADRPERGEKAAVRAELALPGSGLVAGRDIVLTIGGLAQVIPADAVVEKRSGTLVYADRDGVNGPILKFAWNPRRGKLKVKVRGQGSGLETTTPGGVAVAVEFDETHVGQTAEAEAMRRGVRIRR